MNQTEIKEAIAQQEEYIKRLGACQGRKTFVDHSFDTFSPRPGVFVQKCWRCKVTETDADYQRERAAGA